LFYAGVTSHKYRGVKYTGIYKTLVPSQMLCNQWIVSVLLETACIHTRSSSVELFSPVPRIGRRANAELIMHLVVLITCPAMVWSSIHVARPTSSFVRRATLASFSCAFPRTRYLPATSRQTREGKNSLHSRPPAAAGRVRGRSRWSASGAMTRRPRSRGRAPAGWSPKAASRWRDAAWPGSFRLATRGAAQRRCWPNAQCRGALERWARACERVACRTAGKPRGYHRVSRPAVRIYMRTCKAAMHAVLLCRKPRCLLINNRTGRTTRSTPTDAAHCRITTGKLVPYGLLLGGSGGARNTLGVPL
jgi:hypothetical protein